MPKGKALAAIIGPGNIGTDLLAKLRRSEVIDVGYVVGVVESDGIKRARELGIPASADGLNWLLAQDPLPDIVFDATSAKAHKAAAPRLAEVGIIAVDLTPAAMGPLVCPPVNFTEHVDASNVNMISCGAQATVPIGHAVSSVVDVPYAEIVASVASKSAGPGTRANIDEFTHTTSRAVRELGGATRGKAIIILNPVEPPMPSPWLTSITSTPAASKAAVVARTCSSVNWWLIAWLPSRSVVSVILTGRDVPGIRRSLRSGAWPSARRPAPRPRS